MADIVKKKIWIRLKRQDMGDDTCPTSEVYCVEICEGQSGPDIKDTILSTCDLCNINNIVLKLRNHRGSLIPITGQLPPNSSSSPYVLEVVNVHQNIKAQPRSVTIRGYDDTVREKLEDVIQRIEKLEDAVPQLKDRRNDRINNEMREVDQMLKFLQKRISDAEGAKWKGMFTKNPLW